jgi:hypothetical protein
MEFFSLIKEGFSFLSLLIYPHYSRDLVLVGRSVLYGFIPVVCCFIAVHVGVLLTIYLARTSNVTVPALPLSILCATFTYFLAIFALDPLLQYLILNPAMFSG